MLCDCKYALWNLMYIIIYDIFNSKIDVFKNSMDLKGFWFFKIFYSKTTEIFPRIIVRLSDTSITLIYKLSHIFGNI